MRGMQHEQACLLSGGDCGICRATARQTTAASRGATTRASQLRAPLVRAAVLPCTCVLLLR